MRSDDICADPEDFRLEPRFAHGEGDLRVTDGIYKTQMCNFYERGYCKKALAYDLQQSRWHCVFVSRVTAAIMLMVTEICGLRPAHKKLPSKREARRAKLLRLSDKPFMFAIALE